MPVVMSAIVDMVTDPCPGADVVGSSDLRAHGRGANFVLPVGGNQPTLFDRLDALDWARVPVGWCTYDEGHGRREIRTIQVRPAPAGLNFPHVKLACRC